jgi:site-specific DNA-methyltransferase (adenine-specific)
MMLGSLELNRIYQRDCLSDGGMALIPDKSIDMILCDLPYGTTRNKWDSIISFDKLWSQYERIIKDNGAIVLTSAQPFTSELAVSNRKLFRYSLVWDKKMSSGFLNAKRMPLRRHEDILIFYKKPPVYNPQMEIRGEPRKKGGYVGGNKGCYGEHAEKISFNNEYYPTSILEFSNANQKDKLHPTQKPIDLFEYLIRTYTNEGDIVLDNCMGSGTTAVAALNTNRKFIGFETEPAYIEIANKRIDDLR